MPPLLSFKPRKQLDAYLQAVNAHRVEQAIAFWAKDFHIEFVDYGSAMNREQARTALEWDAGTNGHIRYEDLRVEGNTASGIFTEANDFLALVGIESLKSRSSFAFDDRGLIQRQRYQMMPDQPSFQEAMQPAVEWAEVHRPDELAEIYPERRMIYSRAMAERWVRLLQAWRRATNEGA